jgi:adenylylsulfate kinase-like enzyme
MIVWLTGNSGAGKTTIAHGLRMFFNIINLDGDEMRECVSSGLSLTPEDREENNLRVARLAKVLSTLYGYI